MHNSSAPPRWRRTFLASVVILAASLASCSHYGGPASDVWAVVNGHDIQKAEVEQVLQASPEENKGADPLEKAMFELSILDNLINRQILFDHAEHSGITVSEAEVDTQVERMESASDRASFEKRLEAHGMDLASLRKEIRTDLAIHKLLNRDVNSHVSISEAQITSYYNQNKAVFFHLETAYHLEQILVTPVPTPGINNLKDDDAKTPGQAARKIQALEAQLRSGADFATVARNYSEDPRFAPDGGDMGFVPLSALKTSPQIERVVLSLKPGQTSGIIETSDGYHIIKLLGIQPGGQEQLSDPDVQQTIRRTLSAESSQLLKAAYIEFLRDRAHIKNNYAALVLRDAGESLP